MDGKPIAHKYCEGKMKRTLKRGSKDLKPFRMKLWELAKAMQRYYAAESEGYLTGPDLEAKECLPAC